MSARMDASGHFPGCQTHSCEATRCADDVKWIVNNLGELGVKIGDLFVFLYKGRSLQYHHDPDDGAHVYMWRPVGKREFGETCHPMRWWNERGDLSVGCGGPDADGVYRAGEGWQPLPLLPSRMESATDPLEIMHTVQVP